MRRALPIAFAIFLAGIVSYAISRLDHPRPPPSSAASETAPPTSVAYDLRTGRPLDRQAAIEAEIAFYRERATSQPGGAWLDWDRIASLYMERAQSSGDYADWRRAEEAFDASFAAGNGVGPFVDRASFNLAMHRIDRVDADLDRASRGFLSRSDFDAIQAMRGDARYYGGRYAEAREIQESNVERTRRSVDALVSLAQIEWHTGDFDTAVTLMDEAAATSNLPMRAWVLMTRAMLERDRGRLDDARARIDDARALDPENASHLDELDAEIREASGDDDGALAAFRVISSSARSPQSIDGVARILRRQGDTLGADELVLVARQAYESQMALYPEAAWGHAIDHWLRLESGDVDRMITIAEGNARARPYGETRVKLAMAYVLAERITDARRELDEVLATEWSTAELHAVNAIVIAREGGDASAETAIAESIAPGVTDRFGWLAAQ